ncbi:hypothetical protein GALL_506170 [mine drainage metagenome]|uniref:Uncharacterized protein n=1 Tax=mine drainage metagenome TaxID=410659 RepID=A0A1J5P891_9ZZZZ
MRVKNLQCGVFLRQVAQDRNQGCVLENIGMVAGMKGVAITEHASMLTATAGPSWILARRTATRKPGRPVFENVSSKAVLHRTTACTAGAAP